jgi:hypothetical protein
MTIDPKTNRVFVYGGTRAAFIDPCVPAGMWVGQVR